MSSLLGITNDINQITIPTNQFTDKMIDFISSELLNVKNTDADYCIEAKCVMRQSQTNAIPDNITITIKKRKVYTNSASETVTEYPFSNWNLNMPKEMDGYQLANDGFCISFKQGSCEDNLRTIAKKELSRVIGKHDIDFILRYSKKRKFDEENTDDVNVMMKSIKRRKSDIGNILNIQTDPQQKPMPVSHFGRKNIVDQSIIDLVDELPHREITIPSPEYVSAHPNSQVVHSNVLLIKTMILNVCWVSNQAGLLKPLLNIKPIILNGAIVQYVKALNAKYILDNKLGPGAIVEIIGTSNNIPHVFKVVSSSSSGLPQLPNVSYKWSDEDLLPQ